MRRPPPGRGRPHPGVHPTRDGRDDAEADQHQGRPRGCILARHRAMKRLEAHGGS